MTRVSPNAPDPGALIEDAPAKVNLYLHVVGRREDGYHLLDSLVAFAGIGDRLTVEPADAFALRVTGPFAAQLAAACAPTVSGEPDNLVLRAGRALADHCGIPAKGMLTLEKNLPVASGIGGGSADAAAALRLLCRFWSVDPGADALAGLGRGIGADIPVCLLGRAAAMSGTGEILAPIERMPQLGIVLVNPGVAVSTGVVFRARTSPFSAPLAMQASGWATGDALIALLRTASNDLEAPAIGLAPEIAPVLAHLRSEPGCLLARMSGSGATCFGLFSSPHEAQAAAVRVARSGWWTWGGGFAEPSRF